jgi:hypothetical protein
MAKTEPLEPPDNGLSNKKKLRGQLGAAKKIQNADEPAALWERIAIFTSGIIFIVALLILAVEFPQPTGFQFLVFRITLALAAGGFAALLPGFIHVKYKDVLRTGGALGVFTVVYFFIPAGFDIVLKPTVLKSPPTQPAQPLASVGQSPDPRAVSPVPLQMPITPARTTPSEAKRDSPRLPLELNATTKAREPIWLSGLRDEDRRVAEGMRSSLKDNGFQIAKNFESAALVVKITNTKIISWEDQSSNGLILYRARARADMNATWRADGMPLFAQPVVPIGDDGQGDPYDVQDNARAGMVADAVRQFQTLTDR